MNEQFPSNEEHKESSLEQKEATPKYLSYFISNIEGEGFTQSSRELPTSDIANVDEEVKNHIPLQDGNYLTIVPYHNGYRFTFRFLTSAKESLRRGGHAGIDMYFEEYIPNPVTLIKAIQSALAEFKADNYESDPLPDGRLIIAKKSFNEVVEPKIYLSTKDSKEIPENVDDIQEWFVDSFNEALEKR